MKKQWIIILGCCGIVFVIILLFPKDSFLSLTKKDIDNNSLTIYSPLNESIIIPIVKEFQEETGIQVEYLSAGTMELLELLEMKEDKYLMDVMWGGSREYLNLYLDLFEPYITKHNSKIESEYKDENYYWNGFNLLPIVLMYNTKLVIPEEVPKSWEDLLNPKWKGKIAFVDPCNSGSAFIALSFFLELNKTGSVYNWKNVEKFISNLDGKILAKSSEAYDGVAKGDFAIGITMEEAVMRHLHKGADVNIVYLAEGTPVITDSIALMKDAKNKENAKIFIDYVLSKKVQKYMLDSFYLRSIRNDIDASKDLISMDDINVFDLKQLDTYSKKNYVLNKWKELLLANDL